MIMVDVYFPELGRTIDFQVDDTIRALEVVEEIADVAAQYTGRAFAPEQDTVVLYSVDKRRALDLQHSLKFNGIASGERLLVI